MLRLCGVVVFYWGLKDLRQRNFIKNNNYNNNELSPSAYLFSAEAIIGDTVKK